MAKTLTLQDEEAMCLDTVLSGGERTVRVQVNISFVDATGAVYEATREVPMRLRRESPRRAYAAVHESV